MHILWSDKAAVWENDMKSDCQCDVMVLIMCTEHIRDALWHFLPSSTRRYRMPRQLCQGFWMQSGKDGAKTSVCQEQRHGQQIELTPPYKSYRLWFYDALLSHIKSGDQIRQNATQTARSTPDRMLAVYCIRAFIQQTWAHEGCELQWTPMKRMTETGSRGETAIAKATRTHANRCGKATYPP
ncbi:hypothetical protein IRJ41_007141 [Triplophysa rosa]|uniref:Uncharacterized protein n=1 Tax=Triplophysa rosa TaxID=992332 RepID=A0A9W7W9Z6_TRIRA|nr:hypothetical protein IRJ41_007141 [Triplophysa rosa]